MSGFLAGLGLVCIVWGVVAALLIARDLERRGHRVSYVWLRLFLLCYVSRYVQATREETGKAGPLLYHYILPLNAALVVFVVLAIRGWS